jgi:hypothetical protein
MWPFESSSPPWGKGGLRHGPGTERGTALANELYGFVEADVHQVARDLERALGVTFAGPTERCYRFAASAHEAWVLCPNQDPRTGRLLEGEFEHYPVLLYVGPTPHIGAMKERLLVMGLLFDFLRSRSIRPAG